MSKQPPVCEGGRFGGRQSGRKCGDVDDYLSDYGTLLLRCMVVAIHGGVLQTTRYLSTGGASLIGL